LDLKGHHKKREINDGCYVNLGIGIFDIIALPKIGKYYRILRDKDGRHVSIEIDAEAAKTNGLAIHTHLLETRPQAVVSKHLWNKTMVEHIKSIGLLDSQFSGAQRSLA
jgi:ribosomal protein S4E